MLPPSALLARLEHRLPLLVAGAHDLPARQRTMRDAIAWSYDLLDPPEQWLFRHLAVFAGGGSLDAVEAVAAEAGQGAPVLQGLAALVDRSVLRMREDDRASAGAPRLVMLETLREYALECLQRHGEDSAARDTVLSSSRMFPGQ